MLRGLGVKPSQLESSPALNTIRIQRIKPKHKPFVTIFIGAELAADESGGSISHWPQGWGTKRKKAAHHTMGGFL